MSSWKALTRKLPLASAEAIGLGPAVDAQLRLKVRDRGLSEAESILGMAEALAVGAKCLDDLEVARADGVQEELRGFGVPPPQTAGRFLRRFCLGHIGQLNKALRQVLLRALSRVGLGEAITLDFDSTYIRSRSSRRQGADATYLKRYALHPLLCFIAESGICLHAKLRRGRVHTAKGLLPFVDECLRRIPRGVAVRARFDSGFHNEKLFEALECRDVTYLCGVALNPRILGVIREIDDWAWSACVDKDEGEVAEFGYRQADSKVFRRYVVKRIPRNHGEQLDLETGPYNYWVLVTNDHAADAADLESAHRHKSTPVVLGNGKRLFGDGTTPTALELIDTKTTSRGVVAHIYQPSGKPEYGSVALKQEDDVVKDSVSQAPT